VLRYLMIVDSSESLRFRPKNSLLGFAPALALLVI